jgi:carbamoyltransferase
MTSKKFHDLFGGPPRKAESRVTQREMDLARSVQVVTEKVMMKIAEHVHAETGLKNLCLAGGCALNCVANGKILRDGPFENIWIQPAAGDAGGALGAALFAWYQILGNERSLMMPDSQYGSYLGPANSMNDITGYLDSVNAVYKVYDTEEELCEAVADLLADEKIVGHCAGRMEFGPRALGARSILGDPRSTSMQRIMNVKIKFRESFRPFAPSCLEDVANDFFEIEQHQTSPYMLLVAPVKEERRKPMTEEEQKLFGIEKLNIIRSDVPSITHVDYSARMQTVNKETNPRYYNIINRFKDKTGYGVVVNTSFNIRGEPIVNTPENAYKCFMFTDMDALVLENCICLKPEQPEMPGAEEYKKQFKLD